jgi:hypothetical protein
MAPRRLVRGAIRCPIEVRTAGTLAGVTPPRSAGIARVVRSPFLFLLVSAVVILVAAALTPAQEFLGNQGDVGLYLGNAEAIVGGRTPYAEVALEYPPLALVPMVVPYLLGLPFGAVTLDHYKWLFAGWEAALVVALGAVLVLIARRGGLEARRRDPAWVVAVRLAVLVAGAALVIAWRFDLFAALLLAIALWAALADRPGVAGVALGLAVLAKLYPIAAAPALAVAWLVPRQGARLVRFGLAGVLTVLLGLLPFVVMAGPDALSFLSYQTRRGLEVESIGGGIVLLDGLVRGQPVETASPFKAPEVFGPLARSWLSLLPAFTLAGFGALGVAGWRGVRSDLARVGKVTNLTLVSIVGGSVLVLLVTSKVFSIQYVVWLVPFAAILPRWPFRLAACVVALTMPIHPLLFAGIVAQDAVPILVLNLRNALLVALTAWVIADLWRARPRETVREELARPAGLEPTTFRSAPGPRTTLFVSTATGSLLMDFDGLRTPQRPAYRRTTPANSSCVIERPTFARVHSWLRRRSPIGAAVEVHPSGCHRASARLGAGRQGHEGQRPRPRRRRNALHMQPGCRRID